MIQFLLAAPPRETVSNSLGYPSRSPWRPLAPFLLIIGVTMLLIWKYFSPFSYGTQPQCGEGLSPYKTAIGDSCWSIADHHGWSLDKLIQGNPHINCDPLLPGVILCVPPLPVD